MYRVGFGDFFLVTVPTSGGPKHILIDCGVHAKDIGSIGAAVDQMAQETKSQLALVIMTHRHADHISGFAKCKDAFSKFKVDRVWMSWFENPNNAKAMAVQASIAAVANQLQHALAAREETESDHFRMAENITGAAALGIANQAALDMLHNFPGSPPIDYYQAGDKPTLPPELAAAGLQAQILGPPIDESLIRQMTNKNEQYLAANGHADGSADSMQPFAEGFRIDPAHYASAAFETVARKEIEKRVAAVQPDLLAAQAEAANNFLNNQSLVVLFTFAGKSLLFVGDAQWGNWANFLFGGAAGKALTPESRALLGKLDFYKVGHHGSANATPKDALAAMRDGCVAMCSTEPGAYNNVPREPLIEALDEKTGHHLARSDQIGAGDEQSVESDAGKLPNIFTGTSTKTFGYVDYQF